jgi:hypothetical protein
MIDIILRKAVRAKRVSQKLGDALVKLGLARYANEPVDTSPSIQIPIPPLAPLSRAPAALPPEAEAAAEKVGGIVTTPESAATGTEASQSEGDRTAVPEPFEQKPAAEAEESRAVDEASDAERGAPAAPALGAESAARVRNRASRRGKAE